MGALMGVTFFQIVFTHTLGGNVLESHDLVPEKLVQGFHFAMLFAVVLCVQAMIASALGKKKV